MRNWKFTMLLINQLNLYNVFFMQMDSDLPNSFTDFLISESEQIVSQQSDPNVHTTKKSQRSKNFSPEEDCLLVSVWLNTSKDPVTGVDQQTRQFLQRILKIKSWKLWQKRVLIYK